jgi:TIR domain
VSRIFISHSSKNNDKAVVMQEWLKAHGWDDVFLDLDPQQGLLPGERWQDALKSAADRCQAVLLLVTPEWLASKWCLAEFLLAKQLGKRLFPVLVAQVGIDALPLEMSSSDQAVDVVGDPQGWDRLKAGLKRAGLDPETYAFPSNRRPYPGFEPLTEQDAAIFFGREALILRGLDRLRIMSEAGFERALIILGASGAGKSSFLRAGLWPRLERDDRNFLPLPVIRPDRGALNGRSGLWPSLEAAIAKYARHPAVAQLPRARAEIAKLVSTSGLAPIFSALRAAASAATGAVKPPTIVLSIDQAEELLNDEGKDEADRFLELCTACLAADPKVLIAAAIRSDAYPRLQCDTRLQKIAFEPFDLPPIAEGALRVVIEGPARIATPPLKLDPNLVETLLDEANGQDALPLLAFALGRLYQEYGAEGHLTLGQYDEMGRIKGAVAAAVDQALKKGRTERGLPQDEDSLRVLLRETFIPHLARVRRDGEFVRRIAVKSEIPAAAHPLVDALAEARLLIRDKRPGGGDEIVEVAHEALLREWPLLRSWLEADREFLLAKEQLEVDIAVWKNSPHPQNGNLLLSGSKLARASAWLLERRPDEFSGAERAYIAASMSFAERAQRKFITRVVAALFLIAILIATLN